MTTISVRLDDATKKEFNSFCDDVGLSMASAFKLFAKNVAKTGRLPFDVEKDPYPFFDPANIRYLERGSGEENEM
jgi:DNA-damage-inducible protein J